MPISDTTNGNVSGGGLNSSTVSSPESVPPPLPERNPIPSTQLQHQSPSRRSHQSSLTEPQQSPSRPPRSSNRENRPAKTTVNGSGNSSSRLSSYHLNEAEPLPVGYEQKITEQGQIYFLHVPTGTTDFKYTFDSTWQFIIV